MTACQQLESEIGSLFSCSEVNDYVRVRTPFLYPDGDVIDLFVADRGGVKTITDLGETTRWLRSQTVTPRKSPKQRQLIDDVCLTHGVELYRGMLLVRVHAHTQLADALMRLASAAVRVADLWFTFRTRAVESVTDEVADFLEERQVRFERGPRLAGRSGRTWRPDFHTRTPRRSALVNVLTTGSRAAARSIADRVLVQWYELSHLALSGEPVKFISLFDDTLDVWTPEDFKLVSDLSEVAQWSRPDEFIEMLDVAA